VWKITNRYPEKLITSVVESETFHGSLYVFFFSRAAHCALLETLLLLSLRSMLQPNIDNGTIVLYFKVRRKHYIFLKRRASSWRFSNFSCMLSLSSTAVRADRAEELNGGIVNPVPSLAEFQDFNQAIQVGIGSR
jgi:hypothetical protein